MGNEKEKKYPEDVKKKEYKKPELKKYKLVKKIGASTLFV